MPNVVLPVRKYWNCSRRCHHTPPRLRDNELESLWEESMMSKRRGECRSMYLQLWTLWLRSAEARKLPILFPGSGCCYGYPCHPPLSPRLSSSPLVRRISTARNLFPGRDIPPFPDDCKTISPHLVRIRTALRVRMGRCRTPNVCFPLNGHLTSSLTA